MNKSVVKTVNKVTSHVAKELKKLGYGGCCLFAARIGRELLIREGIDDVLVIKGDHAVAINKGPHGLLSSGNIAEKDLSTGKIGHHYWLEIQGRIVDFSHLMLHQKVKEIDQESKVLSGPIKINASPIVSKSLIKPLTTLKKYCEIGYYYKPVGCGYKDAYSADVSTAITLLNGQPANEVFTLDNCLMGESA